MSVKQKFSTRSSAVAIGMSATAMIALSGQVASAAPAAPATNASCPATPGVTPTTINVGIIFPKSVAGYAGFDAAAMLKFSQQNAKGGINGRKIVTTTYDDGANPATQVTVANKAIQQDNMFSIVSASTTDTMYPSMKAAGVPVVGLANSPAYSNDRNVFGNQGPWTPTISSTALLQRFADDGATNVAFVNHNSSGAIAANSAAVATAPLIPLNVALRINDLPIGTYDATSTILRMKIAGVNGVYAVLLPEGGVSIGQAAKQQGLNIKTFYVPGVSDPTVIAKGGTALEGVFSSPYIGKPVGVNVPAVRTYANGLKAAGINPYLNFAPSGYISATETILGLQKAGKCPTRQSFIDGLRTVKNYDADGFLPNKFTYAPTSVSPLGGPMDVAKSCAWYITVKGGQPVPDAKPTCGKALDTTTGKLLG